MSDMNKENLNDRVEEEIEKTPREERKAEAAARKAEKKAMAAAAKAKKKAEAAEGEEIPTELSPEEAEAAAKKKKTLMITLISVGGALVVAGIVCLLIFLLRPNPFKEVAAMYEISQPSKIVATTTQIFGVETNGNGDVVFEGHKLVGKHTLVVGEVDGKAAAVYEVIQDRLGTVEEGGGEDIREPIFTDKTLKEYIEGTGVRTTKNGKRGGWDAEGSSLVPERGAIALNISRRIANEVSYENNKLSFVVKAEDTETLFGKGNGVDSNVSVEIITDGAFVIGVNLSYTVYGDEDINVSDSTVVIEVVYTYDFEQISIG